MHGPVDSMLEVVERGSFTSAQEAAAAILGTAFRLNEEINRIVNEEEKQRRLRQWVERLLSGVTRVAKDYPAMSFSVSVGWPPSVTVTVGLGSEAVASSARSKARKSPSVRVSEEAMISGLRTPGGQVRRDRDELGMGHGRAYEPRSGSVRTS